MWSQPGGASRLWETNPVLTRTHSLEWGRLQWGYSGKASWRWHLGEPPLGVPSREGRWQGMAACGREEGMAWLLQLPLDAGLGLCQLFLELTLMGLMESFKKQRSRWEA